MKKVILFCIFNFILSISINAQYTTFSNFYNIFDGNEGTFRFLMGENKYFLCSMGICDPDSAYSSLGASFFVLDRELNVKSMPIYKDIFKYAPSHPIHLVNDTIYIFANNEDVTPKEWTIIKTNFNGDSLGFYSTNYFNGVNFTATGMAVKDDYLYFAGRSVNWTEGISGGDDIVVLKTDKQGNAVKENRFHNIVDSTKINEELDFIKTADGNFISDAMFLGKDDVYPFYNRGRHLKLIKMDDELNVLWTKDFAVNSSPINFPDLIPTRDSGNVLLWSLYTTDASILEEIGEDFYRKHGLQPATVHKLDKDGNLEWSDTLWTPLPVNSNNGPIWNFYEGMECANGDIVIVGYYRDYKQGYENAAIIRYDRKGRLLWQKMYEDEELVAKYSNFYSVKESDNGDIVVSGRFYNKNGKWNDEVYTWFVRLDSLGCQEPGCGVLDTLQLVKLKTNYIQITGTDELIYQNDNASNIKIYPNPAKDHISIIFPEEYNPTSCQIYNMMGQLIKSVIQDFEEISICGLSSGIYIIKSKDEKGRIAVGKFMRGE